MITRQSDGTIRFVNQACVEMLGWQEAELVGRTVIEVGVYGRERRAEVVERMRRDGGLRDLEVEVTTKLGDTRLALGSILRLELDGEECLVSQFHDMTEHRGLQARLRASEERLRQIADTVQQAFILSLEPVDVGEVIHESLAMVAPLAANRSVRFHSPDAGALAFHVLADRQRLKQALLNLLWNAVKYNREGGDVRVLAARTGPATARIEVVDTGVGIAAGDLARVFTPFERLGAEATDIEGTGLGLALTRHLVEAMGGGIGVDSEPGVGATFWLELPVIEAPEARLATEDAEPPAAATCGPARTVLYIEDNPSNIKLVERILRRRPEVSLLVATLGDLGAELAIEHRPALVVLDLNLPDISGEEVLRRIRGDARTAGTRVVVVSADATSGQIARMREAGADGYLTKPFEIDELLAVIDGDAAAPESAA